MFLDYKNYKIIVGRVLLHFSTEVHQLLPLNDRQINKDIDLFQHIHLSYSKSILQNSIQYFESEQHEEIDLNVEHS